MTSEQILVLHTEGNIPTREKIIDLCTKVQDAIESGIHDGNIHISWKGEDEWGPTESRIIVVRNGVIELDSLSRDIREIMEKVIKKTSGC